VSQRYSTAVDVELCACFRNQAIGTGAKRAMRKSASHQNAG